MNRRPEQVGRGWHAATFAVATASVLFQLALVVQGHQHLGDSLPSIEAAGRPDLATRLIRFCSYLTIWFNVLVAGTCGYLTFDPERDGRVWRALRLDGLVIAVGGGLVHWFLLRPLLDLSGADYLADKLLHIVVPVMTAVGWLAFGPRRRVDARDVAGFLVVPVAWLAYTMLRGPIAGWYPYPFLDVTLHGYPRVTTTCLAIAFLMVALAIGAMWLDRRLGRGRVDATATAY